MGEFADDLVTDKMKRILAILFATVLVYGCLGRSTESDESIKEDGLDKEIVEANGNDEPGEEQEIEEIQDPKEKEELFDDATGESVYKTTGGNAKGAACVFPFKYGHKTYTSCTTVAHNHLWCATTSDYNKDKKWGDCGEATGVPFRTNTKDCWYNCGVSGGKCDWCGTNGYCCRKGWKDCSKRFQDVALSSHHTCLYTPNSRAYKGKTSGGNSKRAKCVFPFIYGGKSYNHCVGFYHNKLWCATTGNYDKHQKWGNCKDTQVVVAGEVTWRPDLRCGKKFPLPNGKPAQCNPNGRYYCCSPHNWCGKTSAHCSCKGCVNYKP